METAVTRNERAQAFALIETHALKGALRITFGGDQQYHLCYTPRSEREPIRNLVGPSIGACLSHLDQEIRNAAD